MEIFIKNKYTNWYLSIIESAKQQLREKTENNYYERHHIIPKSLGGDNTISNLVMLTAKEHFICHCLLIKMVLGIDRRKMLFSLKMMKGPRRYTSKLYDYFKPKIAQAVSESNKGCPSPFKGKKMSPEQREKLRIAFGESELHKTACLKNLEKATQANIGKKRPQYIVDIIRNSKIGKFHTKAAKEKMRLAKVGKYVGENHPRYGKPGAAKGKKWYNNGVKESYFLVSEIPLGWIKGRLKG